MKNKFLKRLKPTHYHIYWKGGKPIMYDEDIHTNLLFIFIII